MRTLHRAIVTGATGAVGTALVRVLAERDIAVTVLCRPGSVRRENIPQHPRVRVCFADLTRLREAAVELDDSCDAFFHLAWTGTVGAARNDILRGADDAHCLCPKGHTTCLGTHLERVRSV